MTYHRFISGFFFVFSSLVYFANSYKQFLGKTYMYEKKTEWTSY